jgi:RNA-binding protein Musashi
MRAFFSQFGRVVDSTVMLDRETGRSKGFGFVSLEDVDVTPILGFGKLEIDGKVVRRPAPARIHAADAPAVDRRQACAAALPA